MHLTPNWKSDMADEMYSAWVTYVCKREDLVGVDKA